MSANFAVIKRRVCDCGDAIPDIDVDYFDCGGHGVTLKQDMTWIPLCDSMVADLVDALIEYQNSVPTGQDS